MADEELPFDKAARLDWATTQFGEGVVATQIPSLHVEPQRGVSVFRDTTSTTNAGSVGRSGGEIQLTTSTNADDRAAIETNRAGEYASSLIADATVAFRRVGSLESSQRVDWGYFNGDNGVFFRLEAGPTLKLMLRKNGTDRQLGGSNVDASSRIVGDDADLDVGNLNLDRLGLFGVRFAWYGAGPRIEWYVERPDSVQLRSYEPKRQILGVYEPAEDSQTKDSWIDSPALPLKVVADNDPSDATAPGSGLDVRIGGRQFSTYGQREPNRRFFERRYTFGSVDSTSFEPLMALRPKSEFPTGRENSVNVRIVHVTADAGDSFELRTFRGTTLSSGDDFDDLTSISSDETAVEIDTDLTASDISDSGEPTVPFLREPSANRSREAEADGEAGVILGRLQPYLIEAIAGSADTEVNVVVKWSEDY